MIDQKTVYAILSDSSLNQTRAQVEALLEKELQKPENEMDAALVEEYVLTLAEMDGADYKPLVPAQPPLPAAGAKRKRRNRSRWLRYSLAAACLCAFMLLVASATGKYVQPSIPAVTVYRDCAVIHYDLLKDMELKARKGYEPGKTLEGYGMCNVLLPMALDAYTVTKMIDDSTEEVQEICVEMWQGRQRLEVTVRQRRTGAPLSDTYRFTGEELQIHSDTIKGLRVFYLQNESGVQISYRNDDTEYKIWMDGSIEDAVEIGNTLEAAIAQGQT